MLNVALNTITPAILHIRTKHDFTCGQVEVITSKALRHHRDLVNRYGVSVSHIGDSPYQNQT